MNVGIIVYSNTGNTLSVAQKLEQELKSNGHAASIEKVEAINSNPRTSEPIVLKSAPDINPYDMVIFASPVHAFSLPPVMKFYISQIPNLSGKKTCCFVTQHFKKPWLGGNHTIRQIKYICKEKGVDISDSGIINWSSYARNRQIADIIDRLSKF